MVGRSVESMPEPAPEPTRGPTLEIGEESSQRQTTTPIGTLEAADFLSGWAASSATAIKAKYGTPPRFDGNAWIVINLLAAPRCKETRPNTGLDLGALNNS